MTAEILEFKLCSICDKRYVGCNDTVVVPARGAANGN
jgi:hypothetical protein